jgi:hypothetical protein
VLPASCGPPPLAVLPFAARAGRCAGGIADDMSDDPGAIADGGGYGTSREGLGGRLESGEEGPGPPGTGWFGPGAPTPGPVRCAEAGAAIASAATIATPLNRCFMSLILCCSSGQATKLPNTQKRGSGVSRHKRRSASFRSGPADNMTGRAAFQAFG